MIDLALQMRDRVATQCGDLFSIVGSVAERSALAGLPRTFPACYVTPLVERAAPNERLGVIVQRHACAFEVLYVTRYAGDATGARGSADLQALRDAVHAALVGWQPAENTSPADFVMGEIVDYLDGAVVWRDEFAMARHVRRTPPNT